MRKLRDILSTEMGAAEADRAALDGLMQVCADLPCVRERVSVALEGKLAENLAESLNKPAFDAFDKRRRQLEEVIRSSTA